MVTINNARIFSLTLTLKAAFLICCWGRDEMESFILQEGLRAGQRQVVMWGSVVLIRAVWSSARTEAPVWTLDPLCSKISTSEQAPVCAQECLTNIINHLDLAFPSSCQCVFGWKGALCSEKVSFCNAEHIPPPSCARGGGGGVGSCVLAPPVCPFLIDTHACAP